MGNSGSNDWATNPTVPLITNAIIKVGWLIKKGKTRKNWNKRYVLLLRTNILLYFTDSNCTEHRGTADLSKLQKVGAIKEDPSKFLLVTTNRSWEFKAADTEDAADWVQRIKQICNEHRHKIPNTSSSTMEDEEHKDTDKQSQGLLYEMEMVRGGVMGWLTKKGELRRNWNSRWTLLIPSRVLVYFTDETCENFKGTADFRESKLKLLFDDVRKNYFFIQTHMRLWEFSCKDSLQVKRWSATLQFLMDIDRKVVVMEVMSDWDRDQLPERDAVKEHFRAKEILFLEADRCYVLVFEDEEAVEQLVQQRKRTHLMPIAISAESKVSSVYKQCLYVYILALCTYISYKNAENTENTES